LYFVNILHFIRNEFHRMEMKDVVASYEPHFYVLFRVVFRQLFPGDM
jgi:hypothetical protein